MVPGIAERERRIADAQRLDWLAEAVANPAQRKGSLARGHRSSRGHEIVTALRQRRPFPSIPDLWRAISVALGKSTAPIPERAPAE